MKLKKLTTLLIVDRIESALPEWKKLGYEPTVRVPEKGPLDFVILKRVERRQRQSVGGVLDALLEVSACVGECTVGVEQPATG